MRVEIKTTKPVRTKDRDIKALYILRYAIEELSSKKMLVANLDFVLNKLGYKVSRL